MNIVVTLRLDLSQALDDAISRIASALVPWTSSTVRPPDPEPVASIREAPPGPSPEPSPPPVSSSHLPTADAPAKRWTTARRATILRDYPFGVALAEIVRSLNALPGPPITGKQAGVYAAQNGARRPPSADALRASEASTVVVNSRAASPAPIVRPATPAPFVQAARPLTETAADDMTIRRWAAERGLCNGGDRLDIDQVNRKREMLGLPRFVRSDGSTFSSATLRGPA